MAHVQDLEIKSIAIPPLGCGNGGLRWLDVRPLIVDAFSSIPSIRVVLFEPGDAPIPEDIVDRRGPPTMTPARASLLALLGKYLETGYGYRLSLVEVQKLAYFLQEAGEPLKLKYTGYHYGPYADNLRKALRNMEGHFTRGLGDGSNSPETPLSVLPGVMEQAHSLLRNQPQSMRRIERIGRLIDGFETPFGMELLGTVHWVMTRENAREYKSVLEQVKSWSPRKRSLMKPGHIEAAWIRLNEQEWGSH